MTPHGKSPLASAAATETSPRQPLALDRLIGARLRALREEKGWSQSELASRCGLSFQQIQKYERGTNRLPASRLYQLANLFGLPVSAFIAGMASADPVQKGDGLRGELVTRLHDATVTLDLGTLSHLVAIAEGLSCRKKQEASQP